MDIRIEGLREYLRALRGFSRAFYRHMQRGLRDHARDVAVDARARAGSWSRSVPLYISSGSDLRGPYVKYRAEGPTVGRLAENRGTWRHPLFGNRGRWYTQTEPGFLSPAVRAQDSRLEAAMIAAVEEAAQEVGLG